MVISTREQINKNLIEQIIFCMCVCVLLHLQASTNPLMPPFLQFERERVGGPRHKGIKQARLTSTVVTITLKFTEAVCF